MSRRLAAILPLLAAAVIAGCDGAQEDAGERADAAAGRVASEDTLDKGPAERMGEIGDRTARDAAASVERAADTFEDRADAARTRADQRADELEAEADRLRDAAGREGAALDNRADAVRGR